MIDEVRNGQQTGGQRVRRTGGLFGGGLFGGGRSNAAQTEHDRSGEGEHLPDWQVVSGRGRSEASDGESSGGALNLRKPGERREAAPAERMTREEVHAAFPEETSDEERPQMRILNRSLTQQERDEALHFLMSNVFSGEDRAALQECLEYAQDGRQNFERLMAYADHIRKRQDIAMQVMLAGFGALLGDGYDSTVGAKWRSLADEWCQDPMAVEAASESGEGASE